MSKQPECTKRPYLSRAAALEAIVEIRQRNAYRPKASRPHRKMPQKAYYCRPCGAWHLTTHGRMPAEVARMLQDRL